MIKRERLNYKYRNNKGKNKIQDTKSIARISVIYTILETFPLSHFIALKW